jgi:hypothetical protein
MHSQRISPRVCLLIGLLLALVAYLPICFMDFGIHNDYLIWSYNHRKAVFPETHHLLMIGRPLGALLLNLHFYFIKTIGDLAISRFLACACSFVCAWQLASYLHKRLQVAWFAALVASVCVFTLPSMQLFVVWATNAVPGCLTVLLAILSYLLLDRTDARVLLQRPRTRTVFYLAASETLFLGALLIYPPSALFVLVFTAAHILYSPLAAWPATRARAIRDVVVFGTGMLVYFVFTKWLLLPALSAWNPRCREVLERLTANTEYSFEASFDPAIYLERFARISRIAVGGVFDLVAGDQAAMVISGAGGVMILAAVLGRLMRVGKHSQDPATGQLPPAGWRIESLVSGAVVIFIMNAPNLLAAGGGFTCYRVLFALSATMVLFLLNCVNWVIGVAPAIIRARLAIVAGMLLAGSSTLIAHRNLVSTAAQANRELTFVRQSIRDVDFSKVRKIVVVRASPGNDLHDLTLRGEFAQMATNNCFIWGIVDVVLRELRVDRSRLVISGVGFDAHELTVDGCRLIASGVGEDCQAMPVTSESTVVIDMGHAGVKAQEITDTTPEPLRRGPESRSAGLPGASASGEDRCRELRTPYTPRRRERRGGA